LLAVLWFFAYGKQMIAWQSYEFAIPGSQSNLIFKWQAIHPFLAEYDRNLQVISNNSKSPAYWLLTNTGGRHHLNLYMTEIDNEKWIRILDEFSECVINLNTLQGFNVGRKFDKTFVAPPAKMAYWGYTWENNKVDNLQAYTGTIKGKYDPRFQKIGQFIGSLDARTGVLRFIPDTEKPEEHIRTMEEQADEMDKRVEQEQKAKGRSN
jgi:hypothetical protein